MRRLIPVLALATSLLAVTVGAEVRTFLCRFHPAREAAAVAEPLLSADGSIEIQPRQNSIVVRDRAEVLQRVASALATWDTIPGSYRIRLRMVMASTAAPKAGQPRALLAGFGSELTGVFSFASFQDIDTIELVGSDGNALEASAGGRYRVKVRLRAVAGDPTRLQLAPLEILRREGAEVGTDVIRSVLKSTVSLQTGQTGILVATQSEQAKQALVLIVMAVREDGK
jgi:hypothetical protein